MDELGFISARDVIVSRPLGDDGLSQAKLCFSRLHVNHPAEGCGGGVVLSVEHAGDTVDFVLDETARLHLINALSRPGLPVTPPETSSGVHSLGMPE